MIASSSTEFLWWGRRSYTSCEELQNKAHELVVNGHPGIILAGEIHTVITQGLRGSAGDIVNSDLPVYKIKRGGETTLHSPGQLVIYPVLDLRRSAWGVRNFVQALLEISNQTFRSIGVKSFINLDPVGLFTESGKIGFCGLQIKNGVSQHGLALNIQNDLTLFQSIVPCGIKKAQLDKVQNYEPELTAENFFTRWQQMAFPAEILQKNQIRPAGSYLTDRIFSKASELPL